MGTCNIFFYCDCWDPRITGVRPVRTLSYRGRTQIIIWIEDQSQTQRSCPVPFRECSHGDQAGFQEWGEGWGWPGPAKPQIEGWRVTPDTALGSLSSLWPWLALPVLTQERLYLFTTEKGKGEAGPSNTQEWLKGSKNPVFSWIWQHSLPREMLIYNCAYCSSDLYLPTYRPQGFPFCASWRKLRWYAPTLVVKIWRIFHPVCK